ncbi:hypothetical protein SAMN04487787_1336 [Kosakonia sacchari]|uniref:Uncharacterized protein n=1 Tax=Kosakonia oryzae TaxID=497725 RepID=A0AA94H8L7_9ENTR|nr:hypothetical protein SAMN04487787_1336 [Kosakonia sacchari]SFD38085.1 hypothetical protein SAMN05216286_0098 [Kosakonia oryzae]
MTGNNMKNRVCVMLSLESITLCTSTGNRTNKLINRK